MMLRALAPLLWVALAVGDVDADYSEQAAADVEVVLTDTGMDYIKARARLVAHPKVAASALLDRLTAVPAPGPAARKRLLDVLAELRQPEHIEMFADELRRAVLQAGAKYKEATARWRPLLIAQGTAATPALTRLVGDKALPMALRTQLLDDLVEITPAEKLGRLVVLVGRGHTTLRHQLRRSIGRRSREPQAREAVLSAADAALDTSTSPDASDADAKRLPSLLQFRASMTPPGDSGFAQRLVAIASEPKAPFTSRVAAVRGLGRVGGREAEAALAAVATEQLAPKRRATQAGEVLAWLALKSMPPAKAGALAQKYRLHTDDAPRLAELGYAVANLGAPTQWLDDSQENPWPQVRQAALTRVDAPCNDAVVGRVARAGGPTDKGGDRDRAVARAAVQALGRCNTPKAMGALKKLLGNNRVYIEQRAEAARQLARNGGAEGTDAVAAALGQDPPRGLARRLAGALRYASAPTPKATRTLCDLRGEKNEVGRTAAQSLARLFPDQDPC